MGTQPHLGLFSYQIYLEKVRPAFQSLLLGNIPQWIDTQYKDSPAYQRLRSNHIRVCPQNNFADCTCFTQNLQLNSTAYSVCVNEHKWHDSLFLRFFEKVLLDECILQETYLSKQSLHIYSGYDEEYEQLGLNNRQFRTLLQKLCNRWRGTWIDVDQAGVGGYLTPQETQELQQLLAETMLLVEGESYDYMTSDLLDHLRDIEAVAKTAVSQKAGLLWIQDLLSAYWR